MRKEKQVAKMEILPQDKSGGREGGSGRRSLKVTPISGISAGLLKSYRAQAGGKSIT
jgi:hypothetical protein